MFKSVHNQFYLAVAILLLASWFSIGFHQSDEHYQILEFAAMRAGHAPADQLPWEYAEQMRPGLQPFMAYVAYSLIGHPFWTAFLLRLLSGAFTLWVAWLVFRRCVPRLEYADWRPWLAGVCLLHWAMWYSGLRFASESWSGLTFALGYLVYMNQEERAKVSGGSVLRALLVGFLFGLAFCFRYQLGLLILGFGGWLVFIHKEKWSLLGTIILGGFFALGLGVLADRWLYGEWVNAPWNYLAQNLIEGKAATFGTRPWWGYFELVFLRGIPPISLIYILGPLLFFWHYRRHPLTWAWVPFLLIHIILSRKDVRFLFPLLPLLPIVLIGAWQVGYNYFFGLPQVGASRRSSSNGSGASRRSSSSGSEASQKLTNPVKRSKMNSRWRYAVYLVAVLNFGILSVNTFRPMRPSVAAARYVYNHLPEDATVIVPDGRPYAFYDLPAYFYRRAGLQVLPECPSDEGCYRILKARSKEIPDDAKVLWTNRPAWLPELNQKWYWVVE